MDGFAFFDLGQHLLFLLFDGVGDLNQVGLMAIDGGLHTFQFFLKFSTPSSQLIQLWKRNSSDCQSFALAPMLLVY